MFISNEKMFTNKESEVFVQDFTKLLQEQDDLPCSGCKNTVQNALLEEEIEKSIRNLNLDDIEDDDKQLKQSQSKQSQNKLSIDDCQICQASESDSKTYDQIKMGEFPSLMNEDKDKDKSGDES